MIVNSYPLGGPCRRSVDGKARRGVLPALGLAVTATALAAAGYHLVFARSISFAACLLVVPILFASALPRSRAAGSDALLPDLCAMILAQAVACCWFAVAASGPGGTGGPLHGGEGGAVHLAMTLVTVCALRAVARSRSRLSATVQAGPRAFFHRLRALLRPRRRTDLDVGPGRFRAARADDDEHGPEVLLTGAVGRRGPPLS